MGWSEFGSKIVEATKEPKQRRALIILAILAVAGLVLWAARDKLPSALASKRTGPAPTQVIGQRQLQGLVHSRFDGEPIGNVHVKLVLDSGTSQDSYTDTTGAFHSSVPMTVNRVHIYASAPGYQTANVDVDLTQQSGIDLQLLPSTHRKISTANHTGASNPPPQSTSPSPLAGSTPPAQVPQSCASGALCNFGINNGEQSVTNNFGTPRPLPNAQFYVVEPGHDPSGTSDMLGRHERKSPVQSPYTDIQLGADDFQDPAFMITCDYPCIPTAAVMTISSSSGNSVVTPIPFRVKVSSAQTVVLFEPLVDGNVLRDFQRLTIRFRARDMSPFKVIGVESTYVH